MSIPDSVVGQYATLATDLPPAEVDRDRAGCAAGGPAANRAKRRVAAAVVELYHGREAAEAAERRFDTVHRQHEVPDDVPEQALPAGDPVHVPALLVELGFARSSSAARRLVDDGAVRVDGTGCQRGSTTWPATGWPATSSPPAGGTWSELTG